MELPSPATAAATRTCVVSSSLSTIKENWGHNPQQLLLLFLLGGERDKKYLPVLLHQKRGLQELVVVGSTLAVALSRKGQSGFVGQRKREKEQSHFWRIVVRWE